MNKSHQVVVHGLGSSLALPKPGGVLLQELSRFRFFLANALKRTERSSFCEKCFSCL